MRIRLGLGIFVYTTLCFSLLAEVSVIDVPPVRRSIQISGAVRKYSEIAISLPRKTPLLEFAALELAETLRAAGVKVTESVSPGDGTKAPLTIVLGSGIDVKNLPPEGFIIRRKDDKIFIAGRDSDSDDPRANKFMQWYARGTLTGVYDFLERFAGVRFYFPGESGTIIPRRGGLLLSDCINLFDSPDHRLRVHSYYTGKWPENEPDKINGVNGITLQLLRLRGGEFRIPYCHGLAKLGLPRRFRKTHPEYFALLPDGKRYSDPRMAHTGQLCFSSGVSEEIYKDMVSALRGEPASVRGVLGFAGNKPAWNHGTYGSGMFCVMPQDWFFWCCCPACGKVAPGDRLAMKDPAIRRRIGEFIWNMTGKYADRLTADRIQGNLVQMAYPPYDNVPECKIPENVRVMVALCGDELSCDRKLAAWNRKLGYAPMIWTYPGKHMSKEQFAGIPAFGGKREIEYYKKRKGLFSGVHRESETDYRYFNHLDDYLFFKMLWNSDCDLIALRQEYFSLMFGPGAREMELFYDELERLWNTEIIGRMEEDELGPVVRVPSLAETWFRIYSPDKINEFRRRFDEAERVAARHPDELKRIRFVRRHLFGVIEEHSRRFIAGNSLYADWETAVPGKVFLTPLKGERHTETVVEIEENKTAFVFRFLCEEKNIAAAATTQDSMDIFRDSHVELFLNPSGDRKKYYHLALSASGALYASCRNVGRSESSVWKSGASTKVERMPSGWSATITLPKDSLGSWKKEGFPVNFARSLSSADKGKCTHFQWSPSPGNSFHEVDKFGILKLGTPENSELIRNGEFRKEGMDWKFWRQFPSQQKITFDRSNFISGGVSLLLENQEPGKILNATGRILLQPDRRYRLAYDIQTDLKSVAGSGRNGAVVAICQGAHGFKAKLFPVRPLRGKNAWQRLSFDFTADAGAKPEEAVVVLWLWGDVGNVHFDRISLREVNEREKKE